MIANPGAFLDEFLAAGCDSITIHVEVDEPIEPILRAIRSAGRRPGLAVKPATPLAALAAYRDLIEIVLVMTVEPGFGGQSFMADAATKIEAVRTEPGLSGERLEVQVDGGVNEATAGDGRPARGGCDGRRLGALSPGPADGARAGQPPVGRAGRAGPVSEDVRAVPGPGPDGSLGEEATPVAAEPLGRRNDRLLMWSVGAYIVFLSILMIIKGIEITPDVLLVALALAAIMLGRGRLFLRDWIPFIGLFLAYELMRGYADNFGATIHVAEFVAIDRFLFLGSLPTQMLQDAVPSGHRDRLPGDRGHDPLLPALPAAPRRRLLPVAAPAPGLLRLRGRDHPAEHGCLRDLSAPAGRTTLVRGPAGTAQRSQRPAPITLPEADGVRRDRPLLRLPGQLPLQLRDVRHQSERRGRVPVAPRCLPDPGLPVHPAGVRAGRLR